MQANKLNYNKEESVYLPSDDGSYSIRKFDWNRIKKIIDNADRRKITDFKIIYSILFGIGGSTAISIIPLYNTDKLPNWVIPLYILTAIFSIGVAFILVFMDKKNKDNKYLDIKDIKNEMEELEKLFPKKPKKQEPNLKIIKAIYGTSENSIDVTNEIKALINDNSIDIKVSNEIKGDPVIGKTKYLTIDYEINGDKKKETIKEGDKLIINTKPNNVQNQ